MGAKRRIDKEGRIVIPYTFKREININNGDEVDIELDNDKIIISNPKGMRSKEEIKKEIEYLKEATSNSYTTSTGKTRLVNDDIIETLKWVLNDESYEPINDKEN